MGLGWASVSPPTVPDRALSLLYRLGPHDEIDVSCGCGPVGGSNGQGIVLLSYVEFHEAPIDRRSPYRYGEVQVSWLREAGGTERRQPNRDCPQGAFGHTFALASVLAPMDNQIIPGAGCLR